MTPVMFRSKMTPIDLNVTENLQHSPIYIVHEKKLYLKVFTMVLELDLFCLDIIVVVHKIHVHRFFFHVSIYLVYHYSYVLFSV